MGECPEVVLLRPGPDGPGVERRPFPRRDPTRSRASPHRHVKDGDNWTSELDMKVVFDNCVLKPLTEDKK
jgi:hypothetical protein